MTKLITAVTAILVTGAVFTAEADACHRYRPRYYRPAPPPRRPVPPPAVPGPPAAVPEALPPAAAPAAPAASAQGTATQPVNVPVGATITLPGDRGTQMGQVSLVLNGIRLSLTVQDWSENGITLQLPEMQITEAMPAQIEVRIPGSNSAQTLAIQLQPPPAVLIHEAPVVVTSTAPADDVAPSAPASEQLADN